MSKNLYRIVLMFIVTSFDFFSAIEVAFFFSKVIICFGNIFNLRNFFDISIRTRSANGVYRG